MPSPDATATLAKPIEPSSLGRAMQIAIAAVISLFVSEVLHLTYANMAVWTTHLVMVKYDYTVFQKGIERFLGRFLGIFLAWVLLALFPDAWSIRIFLETILVVAFFYIYFAQRFAYTFLNAGILTITVLGIGDIDPAQAYVAGREMLVALAVGILAADLVIWMSTPERNLRIQSGQEPLLPIRLDWLNHSAMLTASSLVALFLTKWLALPTPQSIISVFVLGIAPDIQQSLRKGELRVLGAFFSIIWALLTFVLVGHVPYFLVFAGLLFFGMLVAAYLARASAVYGYAGLQMGLVLPMLVIAPLNEFGDLDSVF